MPNPIVSFEITSQDKPVLEDFYRTIFDWQLIPASDRFTRVSPGNGINGGIAPVTDGGSGYATFYVEVDSIDNVLTRVEGHGGRRLMEPQQMPDGPLIALFADPEGHVIGLVQAGTMRNAA